LIGNDHVQACVVRIILMLFLFTWNEYISSAFETHAAAK